jgi:MATE family multidrug resistance protein
VQVVATAVLVSYPRAIASIYTADSAVLGIAVQLLLMAAIFQLSDGLQVAAAGA